MSTAASGESGGASGLTTIGVSIPIPPPYGPQLQARRAAYGDPLATVTQAHITLLGPTEIRADELADLAEHLGHAASTVDPFIVVLRGTGTFRPVSDVVFVQVARGIGGCEQLEQAIRKGRWGSELAFPYHPHVTVAHDISDQAMDRAFDDLAGFVATFEVAAFQLYVQEVVGGVATWVSVRELGLGEEGG